MKTLTVDTTVTILGFTWHVCSATETEDPRLEGLSGYTDWTTRTICFDENIIGNIGSVKTYMKQVVRHEVIHAFMYESGLGDSFEHKLYGQEEMIVDWFAFQIGNILNVVIDIENAVKWSEDE